MKSFVTVISGLIAVFLAPFLLEHAAGPASPGNGFALIVIVLAFVPITFFVSLPTVKWFLEIPQGVAPGFSWALLQSGKAACLVCAGIVLVAFIFGMRSRIDIFALIVLGFVNVVTMGIVYYFSNCRAS